MSIPLVSNGTVESAGVEGAAVEGDVQRGVQRLLKAVRAHGHGAELAVSILNESADLLDRREARGGALSAEQAAFLVQSGAFTESELADTEHRVAAGELDRKIRDTHLAVVADSLSAAEVALRLGIDASRVRHRQAKGLLYGFLVGGKRRYPLWQFTDDPAAPVVPGLAVIAAALPEGAHPATIAGFMQTPQAELLASGAQLTPIEWLRNGGDPHAAAGLLASLLHS
jgi:hypothetical protein